MPMEFFIAIASRKKIEQGTKTKEISFFDITVESKLSFPPRRKKSRVREQWFGTFEDLYQCEESTIRIILNLT